MILDKCGDSSPSSMVVENERIRLRELQNRIWKYVSLRVDNGFESRRISWIKAEVLGDRRSGKLDPRLECVTVSCIRNRADKTVIDQLTILKRNNRCRQRVRPQISSR